MGQSIKSSSCVLFPLARLHLLTIPQPSRTAAQVGHQVFQHVGPWRTSHVQAIHILFPLGSCNRLMVIYWGVLNPASKNSSLQQFQPWSRIQRFLWYSKQSCTHKDCVYKSLNLLHLTDSTRLAGHWVFGIPTSLRLPSVKVKVQVNATMTVSLHGCKESDSGPHDAEQSPYQLSISSAPSLHIPFLFLLLSHFYF